MKTLVTKLLFTSLLIGLALNAATAAFDPASEMKIIAADGATSDGFGRHAVAIDDNRMAVGVSSAAIAGNNYQGAVYIYDFDGTTWNQTAKLTSSDGAASDFFGYSVALSGDRLAVGTPRANIAGNSWQGATYIFDLSSGTWNQTTKLTAADGAINDFFGRSISLSGDRLAIGAYAADIGGNSDQGATYIFDLSSGTWNQTTKLTASDGAVDDLFGNSVSLYGDRLAVGVGRADIGGNSNQGAAYIFDLSSGTWNETTKLTAADGAAYDVFGVSVSLSGDRFVAGAYRAGIAGNHQGAAYLFDLSGGTWNETAKITASDGVRGDTFGLPVSLSGDRLAVGASTAEIGGNIRQGAAYVFDLSSGTWAETIKLTASDSEAFDGFGYPVSLSGDRLAVAASYADIGGNRNQGAVYVYNTTYTIGGSVSGLSDTVVLQNNGGDDLSLTADGTFTFATAVDSGNTYAITVSTQPTGQTCSVTNDSGNATININNVTVTCVDNITTYTIGGSISGLSGTVTLQNNGSDDLNVTADGAFTFATAVNSGDAYAVTISTQPTGQTCSVTDGSGTASTDVSNIVITCSNNVAPPVPVTSLPFTGIGGQGTLSISGGGSACSLDTVTFYDQTQHLSGSPQPPNGWAFAQGLVGFVANHCDNGATLTVMITYPSNVDSGAKLMKWGKTTLQSTNHWYDYPTISVSGRTVSYSITDGSDGDDDLVANGTISDPSGIASPVAAATPHAVPSLSKKNTLLLMLLIVAIAAGVLRQRRFTGSA